MEALATELERLRPRVTRWLAGKLGDDVAEEAWGRTMLIVLRRADRIELENLGGYVTVVALREGFSEMRSRHAEQLADELPEYVPAPDRRDAEVIDLWEAIGQLRREQAQVLVARALGFSRSEMAQRLGITERQVDRRMTRGRRTVRDLAVA
jgi:RNA polymerase sigma factor (sigma-70 family)